MKRILLPICLVLLVTTAFIFNLSTSHAIEKEESSINKVVSAFTESEANWLKVEVALNEVAKKNSDDYTEETWAAVMEATNKINLAKVEGRNAFEQISVDELALELTTALNNLELKEK